MNDELADLAPGQQAEGASAAVSTGRSPGQSRAVPSDPAGSDTDPDRVRALPGNRDDGPDPEPDDPTVWQRFGWLLWTALAGVLTVLTIVVLPPQRDLANIADWFFRLSPLICAVFAAAMFPRKSGRNLVLLTLLIVGFMGLFDTFAITRILEYAHLPEADMPAAFPKLYQMTILLDAFVLISICFAYRLGGAKTYKVVRLGLAGIFVVTSGINDLTYYFTHDWQGARPDRLDAPHIEVFVGPEPTIPVAVIFCVVNLLIAAAIIVVPWFLIRRRDARRRAVDRPAAAEPRTD